MAAEVPKPRRTAGTVAYRTRNYFGLGVLAIGAVCGIVYHFTGPAQRLRKSIHEGKFSSTEEERERKALMSLVPRKRGATIQKLMEESKEPKKY